MSLMYYERPLLTMLQTLNAMMIALFLVSLAIDSMRKLRRFAAISIIALHALYIYTYAVTYNLTVKVYPFFDVLYSPMLGRAVAVLDFSQLFGIYLAAHLLTSLRKAKVQERGGDER
ncbi:MAG: hypothetical protein ABWW70_02315 [Thermoproteota archaeon]